MPGAWQELFDADSVVVDYTGRFTGINSGGSSDTSKDNWLSFWAENEHNVCAVDLNTAKTFCADYLAPNPASRVGWNFIDYSMITKGVDSVTGKRYVFLMGGPAFGEQLVPLDEANKVTADAMLAPYVCDTSRGKPGAN